MLQVDLNQKAICLDRWFGGLGGLGGLLFGGLIGLKRKVKETNQPTHQT